MAETEGRGTLGCVTLEVLGCFFATHRSGSQAQSDPNPTWDEDTAQIGLRRIR